MSFKDGHHILHDRQEWSLRASSLRLRETPSLIPRMDRDLHNTIHRECPPVPLLGHHALLHTLHEFEPGDTTLQSMDNLMFAIEAAGQHPRAHPVEKQLAELAIQAIDLQRPYIAYATSNTERILAA